jgi:vacuolar-type H+-ATPase subunit D/Vma8
MMSDDPTARIVAALDRFGADLGDLREHLDQPRAVMLGRLDRLRTAYSTLQHDIAFTLADRNRLLIAAQSAMDEAHELAIQVATMQKQINLLTARVDKIDRRGNGLAKQG